METIFDYATEEELKKLFGYSKEDKEEYLKYASKDSILADLVILGIERKDKKFAKKYYDQIENEEYKQDLLYRDIFDSEEEMQEWFEMIKYIKGKKY